MLRRRITFGRATDDAGVGRILGFERQRAKGGRADAEGVEGEREPACDHCPVVERFEDLDGYTVNFLTFREDIDHTPLLKGLPDDQCQCPHWVTS
jgi:hypothetical protein